MAPCVARHATSALVRSVACRVMSAVHQEARLEPGGPTHSCRARSKSGRFVSPAAGHDAGAGLHATHSLRSNSSHHQHFAHAQPAGTTASGRPAPVVDCSGGARPHPVLQSCCAQPSQPFKACGVMLQLQTRRWPARGLRVEPLPGTSARKHPCQQPAAQAGPSQQWLPAVSPKALPVASASLLLAWPGAASSSAAAAPNGPEGGAGLLTSAAS